MPLYNLSLILMGMKQKMRIGAYFSVFSTKITFFRIAWSPYMLSHIHTLRIIFFPDLHALNFIIFSKGKLVDLKNDIFWIHQLLGGMDGTQFLWLPLFREKSYVSMRILSVIYSVWSVFVFAFDASFSATTKWLRTKLLYAYATLGVRNCVVAASLTSSLCSWLHSNNGPFKWVFHKRRCFKRV